MIINFLINLVVLIVGSALAWAPKVTTIPQIAGYDIDTAMVTATGELRGIMTTMWYFQYMFEGFLFLCGYFILKIVLKSIFGHRAPGNQP